MRGQQTGVTATGDQQQVAELPRRTRATRRGGDMVGDGAGLDVGLRGRVHGTLQPAARR